MSDSAGLPPESQKETHDFHGFTAPDNAPGQVESVAAKSDLDQWIAERIEAKPVWMALYLELMDEQGSKPAKERWDWRKCLYVAWRCAPSTLRWPTTLEELAAFMGLRNTATIRHWRLKDPNLEQTIASLRVRLVDQHVSDLLQASINCALNDAEKGFSDRKLLLEIAGVYKAKSVQEVTGKNGDAIRIDIAYAEDDYSDTPAATGMAAGSDADGQ